MEPRENILRAVRFERPDYIPMIFHINAACWHHYPKDALKDLMENHRKLFPELDNAATAREPEYPVTALAGKPFVDSWGTVWETTDDGIAGVVTKPALENWDDFDGYVPPDPNKQDHLGPVDWEARTRRHEDEIGYSRRISAGGLGHGHTFLRLSYLRGYENLIFDMADEEPRLFELIDMVETFNMGTVKNYLEKVGVEWMGYAEDLGMQVGPMVSPEQFRKYIKPSYQRLIKPARDAGCIIHMHSDGDIRTLVHDIVDAGVAVVNLQDLVNGIDWIRENLTGKTCVELDIDRQKITFGGTPQQIDDLIKEEVEKLGSKQGGLMMVHGMYPGVPLENACALADAMQKYSTYYS